jgi:hypothetical protein
MREFLARNDVPFVHAAGGFDDTARTIERLAAGRLSEKRFIAWMLTRTGS